MENEEQGSELTERDIELAHGIVDMMGREVSAPADIATALEAFDGDILRVLSYMGRWTRKSFLTQRGCKSKVPYRLFD